MPSKADLDLSELLGFLELVSEQLPRPITLVAAGGTAMTLLGLKASTKDIDFTGPREDIAAFQAALRSLPHGMKVDVWPDGQVFSQILPSDYLDRSRKIRRLGRVDLRALHPLDIVLSKMGRLDERDEQDIEAFILGSKLTHSALARRAAQVQYAGNEENYRYHVTLVLRRHFKS